LFGFGFAIWRTFELAGASLERCREFWEGQDSQFWKIVVEQEWTGVVVVVVMLVFAPGFGNEGLIDWRQIWVHHWSRVNLVQETEWVIQFGWSFAGEERIVWWASSENGEIGTICQKSFTGRSEHLCSSHTRSQKFWKVVWKF
jgi:hypothetical protein